jgi:hypothetical protein
MKLIAHRGLTDGPNKDLENSPEQILKAIDQGFDCEIDLWIINSELYLGHDEPTYPIDKTFLNNFGLWIHAKNLGALRWLTDTSYNFFWHQNDDCVITSHKFIWTFPEKELTQRSIRLMPEWHDPEFKTIKDTKCYGICSDYVNWIQDIIKPTDQSQG